MADELTRRACSLARVYIDHIDEQDQPVQKWLEVPQNKETQRKVHKGLQWTPEILAMVTIFEEGIFNADTVKTSINLCV